MTATTWTELARRAQAATGPDRELDRDVHAAAGLDMKRPLHVGALWNAYSASVDAILALIAEKLPGCRVVAECAEEQGRAYIMHPVCSSPHFRVDSRGPSTAATAALALLAAFCLAMAKTTEEAGR